MSFGTTPLSTTTLLNNQFPVSAVYVPGTSGGNLTTLAGGPALSADVNGNVSAPALMYLNDGFDVTSGSTTDVAVTGDVSGTISAKLRGLSKIFAQLQFDGSNFLKVNISAGTVAATQSGTWNINNISGTISLPTGAAQDATVAKLTIAQAAALGTNTGPLIQGSVTTGSPTYITGNINPLSLTTAGALRVDASATTQPISAVSLPLPTGAATSAKQPALGTAGSASTDVLTVQGITSMTPLKVDGSGVTQPISGTVTANAGTGNFTVVQATGSNLHVVLDSGSTTAVTQATASNLNAQVVGSVASGGSNAGNPLKVGGAYNTTQPTVTTGQIVDAQMTARGAQIVATGVDAFAVNASQSGTWNITNVSGTVSLPTGAATSAKQPALGTAGSASSDVLTVQGIASMTALKVDGSAVTQPVSGTITANAGSGTFTVSDQHSNNTADYDTGAGTQTMTMYGVALPASGGAVAGGTATNPLRVDPTGSTTQPVSGTVTANAGSGTFTVSASGNFNNASVGSTGSAVPASAAYIGANKSGNLTGLSLDGSGNLNVNVAAGSSGNAAASATGSAVPIDADYIGINVAGNLRGQTGVNPSGSIYAGQVDLASVAGSSVATAATGIMKVGLTDGTGTAITSTSNAIDVNIKSGGGSGFSVVDETAWTAGTSAFVPAGGVFNDTATALTSGQEGSIRLTNNRAIHVNLRDASANQLLGSKTSANSIPVVIASDQGAVPASQSGTWNITNVSGTVSLPTGAATAAKQPALGTAGSASSDVITVQGIASMTALKVDGSAVTQPVSGTITANAGTGTFNNQQTNITADYDTGAGTQTMTMFGLALPASGGAVSGGTATNPLKIDPTGTTTQPVSGTVTVQQSTASNLKVDLSGTAANATAIKVDGSAVTQPVSGTVSITANSAVNVAQIGGTNVVTGGASGLLAVGGPVASGSSNADNPVKVGGAYNSTQPTVTTGQMVDAQMTARGAQIVATGVDTFTVTANAGTNLNTSALALESGGNLATLAGGVTSSKYQVNVAQINGVAPTMGNGISGTGVQRVTIASDSTGQVTLAAGANTIGAVTQASGPWTSNVTQFGGNNVATGTGASGTGIPRVTVSNDSEIQLWDGTNGPVAVKPANTSATTADKSIVHTLSPNNTGLPVNMPMIVQSGANKSSGSVASLAKAFTSNNTAGNSIVVVCSVGNGTAPTISDTNSNVYTQAVQVANGTAFNVAVFYSVGPAVGGGIAAGANTITVNNGGTTASIAMEIYEVSGLIAMTGAQPDQTASATGSSATAATSVISALAPNEYAFAGIGVGTAAQTITAGSGWTNDSGQQNPTTPAGLFSFVSMSQYLGSLKSVTPQATFTSEPWAIAVATFRPVLLGVEATIRHVSVSNSVLTSVAGSASSVTLFSSNPAAQMRIVTNDSTSSLYLAYAATATTSAYTVLIPSNGYWEAPQPIYTGVISGIWSSAAGNARLSEIS